MTSPAHAAQAENSALHSPFEHSGAKLKVTYRLIAELNPYANNARIHSRAQIKKLKKSIHKFGFVNPVLIDRFGNIIAGHGRVEAAKLLGMKEVPTICLEALTADQVRAYIIADNRLAEDASWDEGLLKIELEYLVSLPEFEVTVTGFENPEIDLIIGATPPDGDPDDKLPSMPEEVVTKTGDLWCLGEHRVYCGDARDVSSFAALMGDRRAAVVFSDPPYNTRISGFVSGNGHVHHEEFAMASGEMSEAEFTGFLTTCLGHLADWSTDGSIAFIATDWRHTSELLAAGHRAYSSLLNVCVWAKNNGGMGSLYRSQHEFFFVFKKGTAAHKNNVMLGKFGRNRTNVWNYDGANTLSRKGTEGNLLAMHPTVKPICLVADAFLDVSARGDIVLDAFLGSGSTLLAAERVGRICCGLEIEPRYVDLAIRRWQQITGQHAYHAVTGVRFDELAQREVSCG